MRVSDASEIDVGAPVGSRTPEFLRRRTPGAMHHVEIISRLEGDHIDHLEELVAAAAAADGHEPLGEHKFLRIRAGDDLALAFLAYEGERLVGYAHTLLYGSGPDRRLSCELVVHPDYRQEGTGRTLLERVLKTATAGGAGRLDVWAYNDSGASRRLMGALGLAPVRQLLHMHRHPGVPPHLPAPEGATIRPFRPGEDDEAWLDLNNRIFAAHPENGLWTPDDLKSRVAQPWFEASDFLLLDVDGAMNGCCWLKVEDRGEDGSVGEIYVIGAAPEVQGRGLGRYLLAQGLEHLSRRGVNHVAVYVDQSNEKAVALYWAFEFHHHHVDVLYSVVLPAGPQATSSASVTA